MNCQIIYPATDDLIKKHSSEMKHIVRESYKTYNIIEGKKEKELRVFENELFYFNKDWAFNEIDKHSLYCLAIPR